MPHNRNREERLMPIAPHLLQNDRLPHGMLVQLQAVYDTLKSAEKKAADVLLIDIDFVQNATIVEMARRAECSEATLVRLARRLGYKGYPELREDIQSVAEEETQPLYQNITANDNSEELLTKVFSSAVQALNDTLQCLDRAAYDRAVEQILGARRLMFCGIGDSYAVALSGMQKMARLGIRTFANTDIDTQLIALSDFEECDALIAISYSGRTKSILDIVRYAKTRNVKIISITNYPASQLAKLSDIVLQTAAFTRQLHGEVMSKRITQLCIIESLFVSLLVQKPESYQKHLEQAGKALQWNKM